MDLVDAFRAALIGGLSFILSNVVIVASRRDFVCYRNACNTKSEEEDIDHGYDVCHELTFSLLMCSLDGNPKRKK